MTCLTYSVRYKLLNCCFGATHCRRSIISLPSYTFLIGFCSPNCRAAIIRERADREVKGMLDGTEGEVNLMARCVCILASIVPIKNINTEISCTRSTFKSNGVGSTLLLHPAGSKQSTHHWNIKHSASVFTRRSKGPSCKNHCVRACIYTQPTSAWLSHSIVPSPCY